MHVRPRHTAADTPARFRRAKLPSSGSRCIREPFDWAEYCNDEVKKEEVKTALREHGVKHSLFYVAEEGMVELVADLIKEGANVNEKNHVSLNSVLSASA